MSLIGGEAEDGKAPGISSLSFRAVSLTGAVRGVAGWASCESDTRLGVDEFLLRRRAELRLAMLSVVLHSDIHSGSDVERQGMRLVRSGMH